jgi:predicted membrane protein
MADNTILIFIVLIILAILSGIVYVLLLYGVCGKAKKRKLNYLKENGEIIEAEITDFRFRTVGVMSSVPAQVLRIIARTFMYGVAQEFISEKIYKDKCDLKEGDKVRILVNMKNPKQYYFDPYQKEY